MVEKLSNINFKIIKFRKKKKAKKGKVIIALGFIELVAQCMYSCTLKGN